MNQIIQTIRHRCAAIHQLLRHLRHGHGQISRVNVRRRFAYGDTVLTKRLHDKANGLNLFHAVHHCRVFLAGQIDNDRLQQHLCRNIHLLSQLIKQNAFVCRMLVNQNQPALILRQNIRVKAAADDMCLWHIVDERFCFFRLLLHRLRLNSINKILRS